MWGIYGTLGLVALVLVLPATPQVLRAVYLVAMAGFGGQATRGVWRFWRPIVETRRIPVGTYRRWPMRLVDAAIGSVFRLAFGFFTVPLILVMVLDAVGTAKQLLMGQ